ncbi:GTPase HflX [Thalassobacillus sp. C254]|uniref:GTPase HflX n=1 Tax=Thalassobacillus sp. C254 TaxID=1225341 RepID=UPI0012EE51F3|nr:GTPase HflX [Thalassobacillus sp. C254]
MAMDEKIIIVGCRLQDEDEERFQSSLDELASLVKTADGIVAASLTQTRHKLESSTYIGKGKVEELSQLVEEIEADIVVFNDELTGSQIRNLSRMVEAFVIDRTQLILDIFAKRAQTKEGKIQVELAQLSYLLPRLTGQGAALSRLGGGIGTRGPGETKLETDRRHIQKRMDDLKKQLAQISSQRTSYRKQRKRNSVIQFSLVGYTNAGKSTLLNKLTNSQAFEEDLLFATLDPLTRQMKLPSGYNVLLSDTVGFIQDLPTTLVAAFRSTLEEVKEADVLLHVVDSSDASASSQMETVDKLLQELEVSHLPVLTVFNKKDQRNKEIPLPPADSSSILISAFEDLDIEKLKGKMEEVLKEAMVFYHVKVPLKNGKLVSSLKKDTLVSEETLSEEEEMFYVKGYVKEDHPIHGEISKYMM